MKNQKCYSYNDEAYYDSLQEAAHIGFYECGYKKGEEAIFYEADKEMFNGGYFFRVDFDELIDRAYEEVGEIAEEWEFSAYEEESLEKELTKSFDQWCDNHKKHPKFFGVKNPRQIKLRFTDEDGSYEIMECLK